MVIGAIRLQPRPLPCITGLGSKLLDLGDEAFVSLLDSSTIKLKHTGYYVHMDTMYPLHFACSY